MTYFGFLLIFLVVPVIVLTALQLRRGKTNRLVWLAVAVQVGLALLYTTPWDNHLVASGVWYYNPRLVAGIILGYVPLEEYVFFVLETLLVGLWWSLLAAPLQRALPTFRASASIRRWVTAGALTLWLGLTALFVSGWRPGTYLLLTLVWALPPIIIQLAYGADILWHERRLVAPVILPLGLYLSAADALAIRAGIWAIDPAQSTGLFIAGLPIEEGVFFFTTVLLITFGLTLALSRHSRDRFPFRRRKTAAAQRPAQADDEPRAARV